MSRLQYEALPVADLLSIAGQGLDRALAGTSSAGLADDQTVVLALLVALTEIQSALDMAVSTLPLP
jgi:hypothetical protein